MGRRGSRLCSMETLASTRRKEVLTLSREKLEQSGMTSPMSGNSSAEKWEARISSMASNPYVSLLFCCSLQMLVGGVGVGGQQRNTDDWQYLVAGGASVANTFVLQRLGHLGFVEDVVGD
jgi:hypothetical protein